VGYTNFCPSHRLKAQAAAQLRPCATSRKVTGSIPDDVIEIFHWHNPSGRNMALGLNQPLTEMSTKNISLRVKATSTKGWQPYHHPVLLSWNLGTLNSWNPLGHSRPTTGMLYLCNYLTTSNLIVWRGTTNLRLSLYLWMLKAFSWQKYWEKLVWIGPTLDVTCNWKLIDRIWINQKERCRPLYRQFEISVY
jgi:hypothetical protein